VPKESRKALNEAETLNFEKPLRQFFKTTAALNPSTAQQIGSTGLERNYYFLGGMSNS
jgi:hypothetical protein